MPQGMGGRELGRDGLAVGRITPSELPIWVSFRAFIGQPPAALQRSLD
jgi:hypothetical protein